jgi:hypothetical protein
VNQRQVRHRPVFLWGLILVALIFVLALHSWRTLTGHRGLDSFIGVGLGLYICSKPAATAVDLLFFNRGALYAMTKGVSGLGRLALNLLVFLIGWYVIFVSLTHLVGRTL